MVECIGEKDERVVPAASAPRLLPYAPASEIEKRFDLKWSAQPYQIVWGQDKPEYKLYMINYRR